MSVGWLPALHLAATAVMTGVIWIVQLLVYPAFSRIDPGHFVEHHRRHAQRISCVVVPAMLLELVSGLMLLAMGGRGGQPLIVAGLVLLAVIWVSTFGLQVPAHRRLEAGFDAEAQRRLMGTNWIRTALWTVRLALVTMAVAR